MSSNYKKVFPSDKVIFLIMTSLFLGGLWIGLLWLWSLALTLICFFSVFGLIAYLNERVHNYGENFFPFIPLFIILKFCFLIVGGFILEHQPSKNNTYIDNDWVPPEARNYNDNGWVPPEARNSK